MARAHDNACMRAWRKLLAEAPEGSRVVCGTGWNIERGWRVSLSVKRGEETIGRVLLSPRAARALADQSEKLARRIADPDGRRFAQATAERIREAARQVVDNRRRQLAPIAPNPKPEEAA
jgi:hypothetical protein